MAEVLYMSAFSRARAIRLTSREADALADPLQLSFLFTILFTRDKVPLLQRYVIIAHPE